jgi:hypothetical protein
MVEDKELDFRGFFYLLGTYDDARHVNSVWYSVSELFFVVLSALLCGANN